MRRGGYSLVLSRRGMSPLIATVLLMAFAVALGGMIMNWSIDVSTNSECDSIQVNVGQFCTQNNNVILRARSDPESSALQGIRLHVISADIENQVSVKDSKLQPGNALELSIPLPVPEGARVDLIGVVGTESQPFVCADNPIERVDPIKPC